MKNKKAQAGLIWAIVVIIGLIVVVGGLYIVLNNNKAPAPTPTPINNPTGNTNNPTISYVTTDAITNGALNPANINLVVTHSGTSFLATNATYSGFSGDSITGTIDPTGNYIASVIPTTTIVNGAQVISVPINSYANTSIVLKDDPVTSSNTLTQGGGANNITKMSAGISRTLGLILTGTAQKTTGKQLVTLESPASIGTNLSSFTLSCNNQVITPIALPACLTPANAASKIVGWEIPAEVNGAVVTCSIVIQPTATGSGGTGYWLLKEYAEQPFIDSTNTIVPSGICDTSTNGNNANKYQDMQAITFGMT